MLLPQVWIVAVPETLGVHWNTFSGAALVGAQVPLSVPPPLVVPLNVPPCGGMTVALAHAEVGGVPGMVTGV